MRTELGGSSGGEEFEDVPAPKDSEKGKKPKAIRQVRGPTKAESQEHNVSHTPFRDWCEDCVSGAGMSKQHRRIEREDADKEPVVLMD